MLSGVEADELRHHELRELVLLGHEAQFAHEQAEPARLEQTNALVGQNIFGHGGARQLGQLAFTAGAGDHGAHRLSELERIAPRLLHVAEDGDRPVLLDAETDGGLHQDAVGEPVLNELLSLGLGQAADGYSAEKRHQQLAGVVNDEVAGELWFVVDDDGDVVAGRHAIFASVRRRAERIACGFRRNVRGAFRCLDSGRRRHQRDQHHHEDEASVPGRTLPPSIRSLHYDDPFPIAVLPLRPNP